MGLTVVDAGVVIGFLDANDAHHVAANAALVSCRARRDRVVLPASAFAEILVGPSRRGPAAVTVVRNLVDRIPIEVEPLDDEIAVAAAAIRAHHASVKLPDALVIATAQHLDADHLVTTDRRWPTRSKLKIRATVQEL
jgi:predicted nucleic acid-binding protein